MKKRTFIRLFLSTIVVLPAFAQQTNTNPSAQPAASANQSAPPPATAAVRELLPPPSSNDFWDGDDPSLGALIFHPFASKAYVRRYVQPIQDRINELDELTESNKQMTKDVDARAQEGIRLASNRANLADEHALEAANKAEIAHQTAIALDSRVSTVDAKVGHIDQYKSGPTTEIRFRSGQSGLSKQARDTLDEMATPLKNRYSYIIEVQGFSSGEGQAAIASSRKIADSVVRYLVLKHEIPAYRIYVIGMGNAGVAKGTSARVEINLLKSDLDRTAKE
jgi:outer membrane protein OmpA-like peptidoglycan-associated protein